MHPSVEFSQPTIEVASIVAKLCGAPLTTVEDTDTAKLATDPTQEPYAKGYSAVLRALARSAPAMRLLGSTNFEEGQVDSWVDFAMLELSAHTVHVPDAAMVEGALVRLDKVLASKTFLVGNCLTLADVVITCAVRRYPASTRENTPNLERFLETCKSYLALGNVPAGNGSTSIAPSAATGTEPAGGVSEVDASNNAAVAKLKELGIASKTFAHAVAMTVEEQASAVGSLPGALTRNLLFKDKKHGVFLVSAYEKRNTADTKTLGKLLKLEGKTNLRLASADVLNDTLKVKQGCLSYLACMNDTEGKVRMAIDKALIDGSFKQINAHPLQNDRTTCVAPEGEY